MADGGDEGSVTGGARFIAALTHPDDPEHRAPDMLLYRLLKLAHLIQRPFMVPGTNAYELNVNELRLVVTLAHLGEAASHELCEVAALHPMNVSRAVARLRKQGRVAERPDVGNRRRKLLTLTPEGQRLYREMVPEIDEAATRLFAGLDGETLDMLSTMIDRLTRNVSAGDGAAD